MNNILQNITVKRSKQVPEYNETHAKIIIVAYRKTCISTYLIIFALKTRSVVRHNELQRVLYSGVTCYFANDIEYVMDSTQTRRQRLKLNPYFSIISFFSFILLKRYVSGTEYSHSSSLVSVTIRLHISGVFIIMLIRLYLLKRSSEFTPWEALLHMGFMCWTCQSNENIYIDFMGESCAFSFG